MIVFIISIPEIKQPNCESQSFTEPFFIVFAHGHLMLFEFHRQTYITHQDH